MKNVREPYPAPVGEAWEREEEEVCVTAPAKCKSPLRVNTPMVVKDFLRKAVIGEGEGEGKRIDVRTIQGRRKPRRKKLCQ